MTRSLNAAVAIAALASLPLHAGTEAPGQDQDRDRDMLMSTHLEPRAIPGPLTIAISMNDSMHYSRSEIRVKQGETVTFVISNKGKLMHELVIGTEQELAKHAELMRKNPEMEHEEPYMAHVKPRATEKMTWKFTKSGTFLYGCLVAGHFEQGMKGKVVVAASK